MPSHERGLYELLVTEALEASLRELDQRLKAQRSDLRPAEAADRIALHLSRIVQRVVASLRDEERVPEGVALARALIAQLGERFAGSDVAPEAPVSAGEVLRSIAGRRPDGSAELIPEPLIPLLDTTLLTNAPGEPVS